MNVYKSFSLILILLAISPLAAATIYKCDGPDGPIFSDQPCAPDAATGDQALSRRDVPAKVAGLRTRLITPRFALLARENKESRRPPRRRLIVFPASTR